MKKAPLDIKTCFRPTHLCTVWNYNWDEKYAYDIIQKAYWINEKRIEMLDFEKNKQMFTNYANYINNKR